ncbi:MAG: ABC transporter permease [Paracoccus sp. (in: a-proteobacteria)]|uniref:MlaE family ABC transporter permease n=1 Tax=Paracoccus sp. TaxID=267 RepID=UPI0026DF1E5E|nr:ABC transporter permease [Paracoccus sp. (in: a-proteobacteria)]MDO5620299.1 ABC transporter permease [Paracoccus sp. (in: a-proteobacteria)]
MPARSAAEADENQPLRLHVQGDQAHLSGDLTVAALAALPAGLERAARLDLSGLSRLDTAGAWYLAGRVAGGTQIQGLSDRHHALLDSVTAAMPQPEPQSPAAPWPRRLLERMGRNTLETWLLLVSLAEYLGRFLAALGRCIRHPGQFRFASLVHHAQETGLRAVPIVALMSFLIAVVIAFQGATLLKQFGAEIFVVDLIAISILRELGILLTAIIVAGRTASALTASIGSMKMREEIDAMRTLGLDPDVVLVVPRVLALIITLPILGLIANLAGILGGIIMSWVTLGISPGLFVVRMIQDTGLNNAAVGLMKAPVFAVIIGVIGCHAGMSVGKDAESLGQMTSSAVVRAIFAVILVDALFSVFFSEVGW